MIIEQLYKKAFHPLVIDAYKYVSIDSEDLVQEAFIRMIPYQHLDYNSARRLLNVIVKRLCIDHSMKKRVKQKLINRMPKRDYSFEMRLKVEALDLRRSLDRLPPRTRQCIELRYLEGLRVNDVATELHITPTTVSNQISKGLKKLKQLQK